MKTFVKISVGASVGVLILAIGFTTVSGHVPFEEAITAFKQDSTLAKEVMTKDLPKKALEPKDELVASSKVKLLSEEKSIHLPSEKILDVPLFNQMDAPRLYNGCEVTSLAMMLNYRGMPVSKNELATKITRVPLKYSDGKNGNPNVGFVGNMEDGPGLGVYHRPIFKLAQSYMNNSVEDLTKKPFSVVIEKLAQGAPVWVITTTTFAPTTEIKNWTTPQGTVDITFKMHSVVVTGYDQENIYINDPYGAKNKKVNKANFIKAWEQMGSQAIVINS